MYANAVKERARPNMAYFLKKREKLQNGAE
jgi:hypothetical protein